MRRPGPATATSGLAALAALAWLAMAACAENVRPSLGGLRPDRLGDGSFVTPVLLPPSAPFVYPPDAWERGVGGEALLRIHISRLGRVDSVEVMNSAGDSALDSAALASARRLRFRPARHGDTAIAIWGVLPVLYPLPLPDG
ncbi:energy transducer TonB [Candidatus Palauibacter sp.]|uniref:energy transducer TonB n=1 Tax=Candidatus Palauibacter sp. TaxID=3101350 RepID=UPI003B5294EF